MTIGLSKTQVCFSHSTLSNNKLLTIASRINYCICSNLTELFSVLQTKDAPFLLQLFMPSDQCVWNNPIISSSCHLIPALSFKISTQTMLSLEKPSLPSPPPNTLWQQWRPFYVAFSPLCWKCIVFLQTIQNHG